MISAVLNTPLPIVWGWSIGMICRYSIVAQKLIVVHNPFAADGGEEKKDDMTPQQFKQWIGSMR